MLLFVRKMSLGKTLNLDEMVGEEMRATGDVNSAEKVEGEGTF